MQLPVAALAGGLLGVVSMLAAPKFGLQPAGFDSELAIMVATALLVVLLAGSMLFKSGSKPKLPADATPIELTGDEKKDFMIVFNGLTKELLVEIEKYQLPPRTKDYLKRMIEYNVPKGKLTRGLTVITAYKSIKGVKTLSEVEYRRAAALGWTVEWLQAMFLVMDDIMVCNAHSAPLPPTVLAPSRVGWRRSARTLTCHIFHLHLRTSQRPAVGSRAGICCLT